MRRVSILQSLVLSTSGAAVCWAVPGWCGEAILYEPAPAWIAPVDLAAANAASTTSLVLLDQQLRIEQGRRWEYRDTGIRMASAQELTAAGTIAASWLPDKGDLIVHEISIIRDGTVIDVLGAGSRLEVLRREESLEQRALDGRLTATLAVPGLQVGDVLRARYSVTRAEQMLGDEVESAAMLFRETDIRPGFARVRASWGENIPVSYSAGPGVTLPPVTSEGGYNWLELALPLAEADPMPDDAPVRYLRPPMLQLSTFANWQEVSRVAAPFYDTAGTIEPGSELARRAEAIARDQTGELSQAVAALELVQEEIGYLANGLDGGNYLPQTPAETWQLRYGDCKAKTKLLLTLLDELGIEAEAVLVSTFIGDALPELLPAPGVFNHIMVRARIGGAEYWLDGTSSGANVALAGNAPPFSHALPLTREGAALEPIRQILPHAAEIALTIDVDQRAGLDIPVLVDTRLDIIGPMAAYITANRAQMTPDEAIALGGGLTESVLGAQQIIGVEFEEGSDDSEIAVRVRSLLTSPTRFDGAQGEQAVSLALGRFNFAPDRSRRQWRTIPVNIGPPTSTTMTYRLHLPHGGEGYMLQGGAQIDEIIAGRRLVRETELHGALLTVRESVTSEGGEIAPAVLTEERRRAAALARNNLTLRAPLDAPRRWSFAGGADRGLLQPVEQAYAEQIAREPDNVEHLVNRARFRMGTFDFAGAAADLTQAIELDGSADTYVMRSQALAELLDRESSRDDLAEAYALDPGPWRAFALAEAMADTGDAEGARTLIEEQDGDRDVLRQQELALASLDASEGNVDAGLARIDALLLDDGDNAELLNAKCWFMGSWSVGLDAALPICERAVENTQVPAAVLDSRAMLHLRMGQLDAALADVNAALALEPGQTPTLLLRGLIRRARGERGAQDDIDSALARSPAIMKVYRRFGFDLEI